MSQIAVHIQGLRREFAGRRVLDEVNLDIRQGEFVALLGASGAGKTTLLRILAGLGRAARGRVSVFGDEPRTERARARIGLLGHGIAVYDELSAFENLKLFARLYALDDPARTALEWLERTDLARVKDSRVREFSRGMRQRLAVARAFLHSPSLLVLDEPFTALDDRAIALLQGLLRAALAEGRTIVMSTHQLREALELATDVALIDRGRLAHRGPRTAEMLADPGWLYRTYGEA
jgi:heme exporter protein A